VSVGVDDCFGVSEVWKGVEVVEVDEIVIWEVCADASVEPEDDDNVEEMVSTTEDAGAELVCGPNEVDDPAAEDVEGEVEGSVGLAPVPKGMT